MRWTEPTIFSFSRASKKTGKIGSCSLTNLTLAFGLEKSVIEKVANICLFFWKKSLKMRIVKV